jgi:phosphoribosylanthranilate isomerase
LRVKICGICSYNDAITAINAGVDALGFVFYEKSSRYISPKNAKEIIEKLPVFVEKVGLFVHESADEINLICKDVKLTLAQIHFEADDEFYAKLEVPHLKVIRAKSKEDILNLKDEYYLIDAFVDGFGGCGKRLELSWFDGIDCSKFILAGGLDAKNIDEVKKYNFYAVDVSSGVEKEKGVKDKDKIREFIKRAKN